MAVVNAWKKLNYAGKYKQVLMKMTYAAGDVSVPCYTGLRKISTVTVSPTSVTAVPVTRMVVAGGTVTLTVTNPGAACYLFLTADGN